MRIEINSLRYELFRSNEIIFPAFSALVHNGGYMVSILTSYGNIIYADSYINDIRIEDGNDHQENVIDSMIKFFKEQTKFDVPLQPTDFLFEMVGQAHVTEGETEVIEFEDLEEFEMGGLWRINKLIKKENK